MTSTQQNAEWTTAKELAERFGVSQRTVYRWIAVGIKGIRLSSHLLGHRRIVPKDALRRWFLQIQKCDSDRDIADRTVRDALACSTLSTYGFTV